jgi:hypothetical protein
VLGKDDQAEQIMKLLLESWREYLNEVTTIPRDLKQGLKDAIINSQFWTSPHTEDQVDLVGENEFGTPAIEILMDALNDAAENLGTDLYFLLTVDDTEKYTLGPDDQYGGYPNNWMMQGQYRGPEKDKHVIWLEFRPLSKNYNMDDLNPDELARIVSRTINHELVHYEQLKKQAESKGISEEEAWYEMECDPKQTPVTDPDEYRKRCEREPPEPDESRVGYLTRHIEVDAFAHEAAEQLLDMYSVDEAFQLIKTRAPELRGVVRDYLNVLGDNPAELKKFWSKLYTQIERQNEAST